MRTFCTNALVITGHVGERIESKTIGDDVKVCTFSIGLPYSKKDSEETSWESFQIETWRGTAEQCADKLTKGSKVLVEGALRQDRWTDDDGNTQYKTYIRAERVELINLKSGDAPS